MKDILEGLREQFDYIIIDSPPIVSITDPRILGYEADGVIMVIQAGRTQRGVIEHSRELLRQAHAKLLGFVLIHRNRSCITSVSTETNLRWASD